MMAGCPSQHRTRGGTQYGTTPQLRGTRSRRGDDSSGRRRDGPALGQAPLDGGQTLPAGLRGACWGVAVWTSVSRGATGLVVSEGTDLLGVVQAAGRYSLMSPAQVVVRWIGQPSSITLASCWWRVGAENCVVAGQAAFRYSLVSPPQRPVLTTRGCLSGWSGGSVATGGRWSSERWGGVCVGEAPLPSMVGPAVAVVGPSARRCGAGANATVCRGDQPPGSARSRERGRNRPEQAPLGVGTAPSTVDATHPIGGATPVAFHRFGIGALSRPARNRGGQEGIHRYILARPR